MPREVIVQDATLAALAARPDAVARLPHLLKALAPAGPVAAAGCSKCARSRADRAARDAFARARRAVAALSEPDLATLKSLLHADRVTVYIAGPAGDVSPTTR